MKRPRLTPPGSFILIYSFLFWTFLYLFFYLWLARGCVVILRRRRQFPDHKFLQQIRRRILANSNQRIFKNQIRPAILVRIIRIRNRCADRIAHQLRIIKPRPA